MTGNDENHHAGMSRRLFLKNAGTIVGAIALGSAGDLVSPSMALPIVKKNSPRPEKLIYIAMDALHPAYVTLDSQGNSGGCPGNWLMPNIRSFLAQSVWYPQAMAHLPAATDMNHLNAMAGTSSAQTGIIGVWAQPASWDGNKAILKHSNLSFARDDQGRPVDTIFHAWKRRWPDSKTLFISGKEWVVDMFRDENGHQTVDFLVTGKDYPAYLKPPQKERFADPPTDPDAASDFESGRKGFFDVSHLHLNNLVDHMRQSQIMTRLYTGQGSLLTVQMEHFPKRFPHDRWIAESTLEIFSRENPDLAYILLAQCDDGGHCIGTAHDPNEFVQGDPNLFANVKNLKKNDALVSGRNGMIVRGAVLDCIRDIDHQFGRLMYGLEERGIVKDARIILLSDHSAVNHLATDDFFSTDVMAVIQTGKLDTEGVYTFSVSSYGVIYWHERKADVARARALLLLHRAKNPQTGITECPWWVLDRNDMQKGVSGICLPGELYHSYYVDRDRERNMLWPDLVILAKNGWQIPVYNGHIPNVGISVPKWAPPWRVYNGGHGSVDTLPIMAAIKVPGGKKGTNRRSIRISDLGATALALNGLRLNSTVIGRDLSGDLI
jgi:predicted AlkP superfamily pyrophosphatase or phosphodiesterase